MVRAGRAGTVQQIFDFVYAVLPADVPFWSLPIGDPGPDRLFDDAVYERGAMTVHQLRLAVGEADFQQILHAWVEANAGGSVTTDAFIALAEHLRSGPGCALRDVALPPGRPVLTVGPQAPASSVARSQQTSRR